MAKQYRTTRSVGQYATGQIVSVLSDEQVQKLLDEKKEINGLTTESVERLTKLGAIEPVDDNEIATEQVASEDVGQNAKTEVYAAAEPKAAEEKTTARRR